MSTIITSNLGFSDWVKVFHDRTLTAAILDRITHHAALSRNQVKLGFLLAINCFIPDIIANVVAYSGQI
jgi:hypothetical protein